MADGNSGDIAFAFQATTEPGISITESIPDEQRM
jgi:hypothetical protein